MWSYYASPAYLPQAQNSSLRRTSAQSVDPAQQIVSPTAAAMETAFHFDPKQKHLSFLLKENVTADPDIQLRLRGRLNTVTGDMEYHATAQKFVSTGTAVKDSLTQPLRFGLGVGVSSSNSDDPFLTATASKRISLFEGEHTQLTAKARFEVDPRSSKMTRTGGVRLSRRFLDFTAHQDLQLTAGLDLDWPKAAKTAVGGGSSSSKLKADVYLSARENNWGVHYRRGSWFLTCDL